MSAVTGLRTPSNRRIATMIVTVTVSLGIGFAAGGFLTGGFDNDIRVPAAKVETVTPVAWDQGKIDALKVRELAMQGLYEQTVPAWDQGKIDALKVRAKAMKSLYEHGYPAWDQGKIDALAARAKALQAENTSLGGGWIAERTLWLSMTNP